MTSSLQTPADVVNNALVRIGHPLRVGSLYDGSTAAKRALDVYGQTRDQLLRDLTPGFAQRDTALTLLKSAPPDGYVPPNTWSTAYPPQPFIYEYAYPGDCLRVGALKSGIGVIPRPLPTPKVYRVQNDNSLAPPQKVILCYVGSAILTYIGRVTDPTTWEAAFAESLCAALSRRLSVALADPKLLQLEAQDEQGEATIERVTQG